MVSRFLLIIFCFITFEGIAMSQNQSPAYTPNQPPPLDPENTLYLDLEFGRVVLALQPDWAPNHVARIKELTREGFYDGIVFHRVVENFMAQTGDPTGTGSGGSDKEDLKAEFNAIPHLRGSLAMARTADPDSANSQFFICFTRASFLDEKYTNFGRVVDGMEYVDQIAKGEPPRNPTKIIKMQVMADVEK